MHSECAQIYGYTAACPRLASAVRVRGGVLLVSYRVIRNRNSQYVYVCAPARQAVSQTTELIAQRARARAEAAAP